jgi:hypothetical protein
MDPQRPDDSSISPASASNSGANRSSGSWARLTGQESASPIQVRKPAAGVPNTGAKVVAKLGEIDSKMMLLEKEIEMLKQENVRTKQELHTVMERSVQLVESRLSRAEATMVSNLELLERKVQLGASKRRRVEGEDDSATDDEDFEPDIEEVKAMVQSEAASHDNSLLVSVDNLTSNL